MNPARYAMLILLVAAFVACWSAVREGIRTPGQGMAAGAMLVLLFAAAIHLLLEKF